MPSQLTDLVLSQNGDIIPSKQPDVQSRASELQSLLEETLRQVVPFAQAADDEVNAHRTQSSIHKSALIEHHEPAHLSAILSKLLTTPSEPRGQDGFREDVEDILRYSVNTLCPGFMDKLYAAPLAPGIAADLILSVLNTNVHVYHVSPVLTLIEKQVTKALASLFGFSGPRSGGINVQGGSASNATSIVIARNSLHPNTKVNGNAADGLELVLFTSAHGHYSIEKAAMSCGFGSSAVISVPVDAKTGAIVPSELERLVIQAKEQGKTPFYVNATAGTTVLGSYDPFPEISAIAHKHNMWMHIDGSWGGSFVFSDRLRYHKLKGCELADSIAVNPHKMMGVPVTCSFLLAKDLKQFHDANTLRAGYLFHDSDLERCESRYINGVGGTGEGLYRQLSREESCNGRLDEDTWQEPNDLADLTLQCGRRGDSLKLFMAWRYYGTDGYREKIENAYETACYTADLVSKRADMELVSEYPVTCLQVCFYYVPNGKCVFGKDDGQNLPPDFSTAIDEDVLLGNYNSKLTEKVTKQLVPRGFMIDFAPALEGQIAQGKFFRVVINIQTPRETVERLVQLIDELGRKVAEDLRKEYGRI